MLVDITFEGDFALELSFFYKSRLFNQRLSSFFLCVLQPLSCPIFEIQIYLQIVWFVNQLL